MGALRWVQIVVASLALALVVIGLTLVMGGFRAFGTPLLNTALLGLYTDIAAAALGLLSTLLAALAMAVERQWLGLGLLLASLGGGYGGYAYLVSATHGGPPRGSLLGSSFSLYILLFLLGAAVPLLTLVNGLWARQPRLQIATTGGLVALVILAPVVLAPPWLLGS
ncbi:MAG TPA: hypothetical protein VGR57_01920 [Ktedonobacterales bacterium]|nr:hypothetical protein [Ktedonobacterales bacterium]